MSRCRKYHCQTLRICKFQLSSSSFLDYLCICLLITINIQRGAGLRGITGGLIYRGTKMSRGHSGWGDWSWLALMGHEAQTRKQSAWHWAPSWTDGIIRHSLCLFGIIPTGLALLIPIGMCGYRNRKGNFLIRHVQNTCPYIDIFSVTWL